MSRKLGLVALLVVAGSTKPLAPLPQTAHAARDAIPITIRQAESTTPSVTAEPGSAIPSGILPTGIIDEAIVAVASEGDGDEPAMTASSCSLVSLEPSAASALGGVIVNVGPQVSSLLPRCQCGTAILGIEYTLGKDGQSTFYCAAEGAQETEAVSTATASGAIGDPSNAAWAQVTCDEGSLTEIENNPWEQWNDSGAAAAWDSMTAAWGLAEGDEDPSFADFIGSYFNARPDLACDELSNPNCEVTVNCGQGITEANAAVSSPAGYVIINSMVWLHMIFENLWDGINDAMPQVLADVGVLVETLSPITDEIEEQQRLRLTLDGIQMALFLIMAPSFHSQIGVSKWAKANPNEAAIGFDVSYGALGTSMAFAKDAVESKSTLPVQNSISSYLGNATDIWLHALEDSASSVFNEPESLFQLVDRGMLFGNGQADESATDVLDAMKTALYASLVRALWTSGSDPVYPVIVTNEGLEQDGSGCESWLPQDYVLGTELSHSAIPESEWTGDVVSESRICKGNTAYWLVLVGVKEGFRGQCSMIGLNCLYYTTATFSTPQGLTTLDGEKFGGLTKESLAWNAINTWFKKGETNSDESTEVDFSDMEVIDNFASADLEQTYGLVNIPVCSLEDLLITGFEDHTNADENPNYPCPA